MAYIRQRPVRHSHPVLLFGLFAAAVGVMLAVLLTSPRLSGWIDTLDDAQERSSTAFRLDAEGWTEFDIDPPDGMIRLLFNATAEPSAVAPDSEALEFGIEYELIDSGGQPVGERTRRFMLATVESDPASSPQFPTRIVKPYVAPASTTQLLLLDTWAQDRADRLRVRRIDGLDARVRDIVIRSYSRPRLSERDSETGWLRINRATRERLAKNFAYPPELLPPEDQETLVRSQWQPLGPQGVDGRDYFSARLRTRSVEDENDPSPRYLPWGLYSDALRTAVAPYSAPSGRVRVTVTPLTDNPEDLPAQFTWYPPRPGPPRTETVKLGVPIERDRSIGWVGVSTPVPAIVRVADAESGEDLTPPTLRSSAAIVPAGEWIELPINHVLDEPTPLRVDVRYSGRWPPPDQTSTGRVRYQWTGHAGATLDAGEIEVSRALSSHEWIGGKPSQSWVSAPHSLYWLVPARAGTLRIQADNDILISAYDRPLNLRHLFEVPAQQRPWLPDSGNSPPEWFPLRPQRGSDVAYALIRRQPRPPARDPDVLAGEWLWQSWPPEPALPGAWFMLERDADAALRQDALASTFSAVATGRDHWVTVAPHADGGEAGVELLYRDRKGMAPAQVLVDGAPLDTAGVFGNGPNGRLKLPPLTAGRHRLHIEDPENGHWLASHLSMPAPQYLRVFAHRLLPQTVQHIPVGPGAASGPRHLSIRLLAPPGTRTVELVATLKSSVAPGTTPINDWNAAERVYQIDIEPPTTTDAWTTDWWPAPTAHFPLNAGGTPEFPLKLELRTVDSPAVYVAVFEIAPGVHSHTKTRRMSDPEDAE